MLSFNRPDQLVVRNLRTRLGPADTDAFATRMHLERLLATISPDVTGLSPTAIVCVRKISDPLPGALDARAKSSRSSEKWERGLRETLERRIRGAARPAFESVPADADAVLFTDRAEMLWCLVRDGCQRAAWSQWWWPALFGGRPLETVIAAELIANPGDVPSVLARVTDAKLLPSMTGLLSPTHAVDVQREMVRFFALGGSTTTSSAARSRKKFAVKNENTSDVDRDPSTLQSTTSDTSQPSAPWVASSELASVDDAWLSVVTLALGLHRAPSAVHAYLSRDDATRIHEASAERLGSIPQKKNAVLRHSVAHAAEEPRPHEQTGPRGHERVNPPPDLAIATASTAAEPEMSQIVQAALPATQRAPTLQSDRRSTTALPPVVDPSPSSRRAAVQGSDGSSLDDTEHASEVPRTRQVDAPGSPLLGYEATPTMLGGIFYLVNVALAMNLYPDFTQPADTGPCLSIWDFVAELAQRLLEERREDSVWELLLRLSRRDPSQPAGAGFSLPPHWALPPQWSALVTSTSLSADESAHTGRSAFLRFMDTVVPPIETRLRAALGGSPIDDVGRTVLAHSATVHTTDARVDVMFRLAELPIAIRIAGLDRDPGFLPTEGRSLHFHFN